MIQAREEFPAETQTEHTQKEKQLMPCNIREYVEPVLAHNIEGNTSENTLSLALNSSVRRIYFKTGLHQKVLTYDARVVVTPVQPANPILPKPTPRIAPQIYPV
jgi:hypothetical protein